ncbi:MAG: KdsC family phosphatase [Bacteroidales bacterium]
MKKKFFKEEIKNIQAFVFDVDGVLSKDVSPLDENGDPVRTGNVKDGYIIRYAIKRGLQVAVITGGSSPRVRQRLQKLDVTHIYEKCFDKDAKLKEFSQATGIALENMLYMGDDVVDLAPMSLVALSACPADAAIDVINASDYISPFNGGEGCVRDVIEQTLRCQDLWKPEDFNKLLAN